ncbi:unnamed protein product, partial [Ectocarpus sp. 12 AP-2014]
ILGDDLCGQVVHDPWMLKTHRAGEKRSLFTGHSDVHFVSAHVEHDGRGGVRAKGGYVLYRGEEDRVAASVAAEAAAGGRETEATAGGRETQQQQQQQQPATPQLLAAARRQRGRPS